MGTYSNTLADIMPTGTLANSAFVLALCTVLPILASFGWLPYSIIAMVGPIAMLIDAIWDFIKPWFARQERMSSPSNTITLRCVTGVGVRFASEYDKLPDTHYHAVVWYIANVIKHVGDYSINTNDYSAGGKTIPLNLGNVQGIVAEFGHATILISHQTTDSPQHGQYNCDLKMSSESNDVIVDFMNHCLSLFKDAQERDIGSDLTVFLMGNIHSQLWRGYRMRINKTFENTYYPSEIKNTLVNDAINFIQSEARYRNLGIPYKRGYLLYGPPGTGKSSAWYALARKLGRNVYKLSLESSNIGVIRIAVSAIPPNSIMVIDDIDAIPFDDGVDKMSTVTTEDDADAILSTTAISSATPLSRRPVSGSINISTLLDILDGYDYLHGCFVIFTSNYPERLDKRLLRSGRVDLTLHIDLPTPSVIRDMFMYVYGECPEIPDDTKITVTTADIMSRVITLNQDYDHAVHALNELLTDKNITTEDSLSDESDAD